jgi:hypothetical protein
MSLQIELRDCADSVTIARTGLLREAADALDALTAENAALKANLLKLRNHIVTNDDEGLAVHSNIIVDADCYLFWKDKP